MAAFERIKCGIEEMDTAVDSIRLGDNVVWRVDDLSEFKEFMLPFVKQAIEDGRNLLYIRFASHEPLLTPMPGLKIVEIPLSHRFETFTVEIHNLIEKEGFDAFYVFDCLSELQTAWATDLMMSNFFMVTCPFLFVLDTVAYFPIIRGKHSAHAVAKIRDTTQDFFDVYSDPDGESESHLYVNPLKVWKRYSETMFLAHEYTKTEEGGEEKRTFRPIQDGITASRFYTVMNDSQRHQPEHSTDSWNRFFSDTLRRYEAGENVSEQCGRMCDIMMTRDRKLRGLIRENFTPEDYFEVRRRMVGTGMIGGKACGMLLARKLINNHLPEVFSRMEPHDSFYIGSDVFYAFIVENHFWDVRIRQRTEEEYFSLADEFSNCLKSGKFSDQVREQFLNVLDYYGQAPIIVRSSSILEDGFGNAFAGKYESVFCANLGTIEERLEAFENAVRTVYASTMSRSALDYRMRRGLDKRDEQMAILVQRVSGSRFGDYFFPCAAGVGYSYSVYRFLKDLDPAAGMLRLVMGLGTGAVDRVEGSYPRLIQLDKPQATSYTSDKDKHRFSQRLVDVVDMKKREHTGIHYNDILEVIPNYMKNFFFEHDYEAERMFRDRGQNREILYLSCAGVVKRDDLMRDMKRMLATIQDQYEYPVDIEYTINISEKGQYVINLLQCRPLQVAEESDEIAIPTDIDPILETVNTSMGKSAKKDIAAIVYVDAIAYYEYEYAKKPAVARAIGAINWLMRENPEDNRILIVPGRIGTSSPELGVPTSFADISGFCAICEVSESKAGYIPELSYGSHIFQDLVEADIIYDAVFENEHTKCFDREWLLSQENKLGQLLPEHENLSDIIHVIDTRDMDMKLFYDMKSERMVMGK